MKKKKKNLKNFTGIIKPIENQAIGIKTPSIDSGVLVTASDNTSIVQTKSLCDKARRLVWEEEDRIIRERVEKENEFLTQMFGPDFKKEIIKKDEEYIICGRRWICVCGIILRNVDTYMNIRLGSGNNIHSMIGFGQELIYIDRKEQELRTRYPNNWLGRLKLRFDRFSIF